MKETIIKPKKTFDIKGDLKEIWDYKNLLYFLTWRDLKVRYKQTFIGIAWAIFQPLITMIVFSIFFGKLAQIPSDGIPYPIFVYVGLLLWQFFSNSLMEISNCLISNKAIVTKVYFPRLVIPISILITKFVDFLVASVILIGLMFYYGYTPNLIGCLILPLLIIITFTSALGLGLFLSSINVKYRDVRYALPFLLQLMMFVTPVIYPISLAGKYSKIILLNPMAGVIDTARAAILGNSIIDWGLLNISFILSIVFLVFGVYIFKKTERYFADIV